SCTGRWPWRLPLGYVAGGHIGGEPVSEFEFAEMIGEDVVVNAELPAQVEAVGGVDEGVESGDIGRQIRGILEETKLDELFVAGLDEAGHLAEVVLGVVLGGEEDALEVAHFHGLDLAPFVGREEGRALRKLGDVIVVAFK